MHPWAMVSVRVFVDILISGLRIHFPFYIMQCFFPKDFFTGAVFFLKVTFTKVVIYAKDSFSDFINLNCFPLYCAYKGNEEAD